MNPSEKRLAGTIALVTGGTHGIGKAIADKLYSAGAKVIVTARRPSEEKSEHHFIAADLTDKRDIARLTQIVLQEYGTPDIPNNNVGGTSSPPGGFQSLSDEDWSTDIDLNLMATIRLDKAIVPEMIEKRSGAVIHISSQNGKIPLHQSNFSYGVMKSALNAYSKTLATKLPKRVFE